MAGHLPLIATSLGQWQAQGHLGDLLKAMRRDFQKAKDRAPSILMIDELDSLGDRQKFSHDNSSYSIQVVNALLECLDGVGGRDGVVIIGATNHPSKIDPAILRAGRFDNHIEIERPDKASRIAIIEGYLDMKIGTSDSELVASQSSGLSGADLAKACRDARRTARIQKREVNAADVIDCLPRLVKIDKDQRRTIAVHEAGHTLVGIKLGVGTFQGTMIADWIDPAAELQAIGGARFSFPSLCNHDREYYLDRICLLMGGIAAEVVTFGKHVDGAGLSEGTDLEVATTLATILEAQSGVGSRFRYSRIASAEDGEDLRRRDPALAIRIEEILAAQFERAKEIIVSDRGFLDVLTRELVQKGLITNAVGWECARADRIAAE